MNSELQILQTFEWKLKINRMTKILFQWKVNYILWIFWLLFIPKNEINTFRTFFCLDSISEEWRRQTSNRMWFDDVSFVFESNQITFGHFCEKANKNRCLVCVLSEIPCGLTNLSISEHRLYTVTNYYYYLAIQFQQKPKKKKQIKING